MTRFVSGLNGRCAIHRPSLALEVDRGQRRFIRTRFSARVVITIFQTRPFAGALRQLHPKGTDRPHSPNYTSRGGGVDSYGEFKARSSTLENGVLKLVPYVPSLHSQLFFDGISGHPELFRWTRTARFTSVEDLDDWAAKVIADPAYTLFAMIDKTRPATASGGHPTQDAGALAGIVAFIETPEQLTGEIGLFFTLPAFQRTHVTRTAVALLLRFAFDELRLRRMQWRCQEENIASVRAAERMGFQKEGVHRWHRVAPAHVPGHAPRAGDPMPSCMGLHVLYLAICWDDWESGWAERTRRVLGNRV
ncbi:GNAT family N-acetyltransferase [Phanerochaete sordida]|uniref:GNAT family N-acetyltransferase n=1 Tax=Phanerochaete sordida TaxID=48140 RepID=A0A9P3GVL6_9APHY|nr:GNAT family N-acetyltransferase [Phanerochaete sordida]